MCSAFALPHLHKRIRGADHRAPTLEVPHGSGQQALHHAELEGAVPIVAALAAALPRDVDPQRLRQFHRVRLPPALHNGAVFKVQTVRIA